MHVGYFKVRRRLKSLCKVREGTLVDDTDYALGRTNIEYERLIEQAKLMRPLTERVLRAAGIVAGMRVLNIGSGMGDVSFLVSELVGTTGSVVGVDLDRAVLRLADQRRVGRRLENISFREGDARSVGSEGPFDAVVGRFVFMYFKDLTDALRLMAERVRAGGIVAFHEW
jgi:ubiquinone/menaquinone biosynthesis C-methylase UbiE